MPPNHLVPLRWYFRFIGVSVVFFSQFILWFLVPVRPITEALFPSDPDAYIKVHVTLAVVLLVSGFLALATASALKRGYRWARWTGLAACAGLLCGFPWLTLAGAGGLVWLSRIRTIRKDPDPSTIAPSFEPHRGAAKWAGYLVSVAVLVAGSTWLYRYAAGLGLPKGPHGMPGILVILFLAELLAVTLHELGHAGAAWAVHFRFKAVQVGPVTVWKGATGRLHFQLNLSRIFDGGGYMQAVPSSPREVRLNQILVLSAGPFVSLNAGLLLFLVVLMLPGTRWQGHWEAVGLLAIVFGADFIRNLVPLDAADGARLFHLLFWTRAGREFSALWLAGKDLSEAEAHQAGSDFESELEHRRRALENVAAHVPPDSPQLAGHLCELGFAEQRAGLFEQAGRSLNKCLEILRLSQRPEPLIEANAWLGLHSAYALAQRPEDARRAYDTAVPAFAACLENVPARNAADLRRALAEMHITWRAFDAALDEIAVALAHIPARRENAFVKGKLFGLRAECEFARGFPDRAREAALEAVKLLESCANGEAGAHNPLFEIAEIGMRLWNEGETPLAGELISIAIEALDRKGPAGRSARARVMLALVLRQSGKAQEARAVLPTPEGLSPGLRRKVLEEQANIHARLGEFELAAAAFEQVLQEVEGDARASAVKVACARCELAGALLDAGRLEEAEPLARAALDTLTAANHPEASECLIVWGILAARLREEAPDAYIEEARRIVSEAPLVGATAKARFFETAAARLARHGIESEEWEHPQAHGDMVCRESG